MTMMTGEIGYDNLFFPVRGEITPKGHISIPGVDGTIVIPDLTDADLSTFPKAQYFPITAHLIGLLAIFLVSIVIFNLVLGIAVSDVQVSRFFNGKYN